MEKDILILNSKLLNYNFENGERTFNRVTFGFRDNMADDKIVGFNEILTCSLDPNSFDITKAIKPNELVKANLELKPDKEPGKFKYTITKIKGIEVA